MENRLKINGLTAWNKLFGKFANENFVVCFLVVRELIRNKTS